MDTKAKDLFEKNSDVDTLYKVKTKSIYFTSEEGAKNHVGNDEEKLDVLKRSDFLPEEQTTDKKDEPPFPEGDPTDDWKNDEIRAWLDSKEVTYAKGDIKAELLEKVAEYLNPKTPAD